MKLSKERRSEIIDLVHGTIKVPPGSLFDGDLDAVPHADLDARTDDFLKNGRKPLELHYFADHWKWNGGMAPLLEIIRNPACDLSTARKIYCRLGHGYLVQYPERDDAPPDYQESWDLSYTIVSKVAEGKFGEAKIPYSPREEDGDLSEFALGKQPEMVILWGEFIDPDRVSPPDPATRYEADLPVPDVDCESAALFDFISKHELVMVGSVHSNRLGKDVTTAVWELLINRRKNRKDLVVAELWLGLEHPSIIVAAYCTIELWCLAVARPFHPEYPAVDLDALREAVQDRTETFRYCSGYEEREKTLVDILNPDRPPYD